MSTHRMMERLAVCETIITGYPTSFDVRQKMQQLDMQMEEMQRGREKQCRQTYSTDMPFSEPVYTYHLHRQTYQGLLCILEGDCHNASKAFRAAIRYRIPTPHHLSSNQCQDGVKVCL
jgi:hypothetical protein